MTTCFPSADLCMLLLLQRLPQVKTSDTASRSLLLQAYAPLLEASRNASCTPGKKDHKHLRICTPAPFQCTRQAPLAAWAGTAVACINKELLPGWAAAVD